MLIARLGTVWPNWRTMTKPITTKLLADATGLSPKTIRRLERRGVIRAVRDFRGWRQFAPSEVERLRELLGWAVLER